MYILGNKKKILSKKNKILLYIIDRLFLTFDINKFYLLDNNN